jgi:hypothetical protein
VRLRMDMVWRIDHCGGCGVWGERLFCMGARGIESGRQMMTARP